MQTPSRNRPKTLILSANDLRSGDVLYAAGTGGWTRVLADARIFQAEVDAATALAAAETDRDVLAAFLAPVAVDPAGRPHPIHLRDRLRASGPSIVPSDIRAAA